MCGGRRACEEALHWVVDSGKTFAAATCALVVSKPSHNRSHHPFPAIFPITLFCFGAHCTPHCFQQTSTTQCETGYTGFLCASCSPNFFSDVGGLCSLCPTKADTTTKILWLLAAFAAITLVSFSTIAVVQLSFKQGLGMGFLRSLRFTGWIIAVLAMQAQIGRTATSGQPAVLNEWFQLLKIFEFNPGGASPSQCSDSVSTVAIVAMSITICCALIAAFLSLRCVGILTTAAGDAAVACIFAKVCCNGKTDRRRGTCVKKVNGSIAGVERESTVGESPADARHRRMNTFRLADPKSSLHLESRTNPLALDLAHLQHSESLTSAGNITDRKYSRAALLSIRYYRTTREELALAKKEGRRAKKKRVAKEKKMKKRASTRPKKNHGTAFVLGTVRKMLIGTVLLIHPLVANLAFSAVYCVRLGGAEGTPENDYRVASDLTKLCFEGDHLPVFILACFAIAITIVSFPIVLLVQLSRSSDCFGCGQGCDACSKEVEGGDDRAMLSLPVVTGEADNDEEEFAPSGGLCCRNATYMRCVTRNRIAMDEHHSKVSRRDDVVERFEAFSSLTHAEYKPEYFWVRCVRLGRVCDVLIYLRN